MKNSYRYARFYDFCANDDYKNPGRGVIKRKERVAVGSFAYILFVVYLLLFIMDINRNIYLLIIIFITFIGFTYETKTGVNSYYNYCVIKRIRAKSKPNILEQFCIYYNRDGNYIKIQEKQMTKIKYHPFNWTVVKILFKDKYRNKYVFRVNLTNIIVKIYFSKAYKKEDSNKRNNRLKTTYKYNLDDLDNISNTKEFMIFLRDKYREISEVINS